MSDATQQPEKRPATRDANGRWLRGSSPNPGGRPKREAEIREAFQDLGAEAVERIRQLMRSTVEQVAVAACRLALERGYGKPAQQLTVEAKQPQAPPTITTAAEAAALYHQLMSGDLDVGLVEFAPSEPAALPAPDNQLEQLQIAQEPPAAVPMPIVGPVAEPIRIVAPEAAQAAIEPAVEAEVIPGSRPLTAQQQREREAQLRRAEFEQQLEAENERRRAEARLREERMRDGL